LAQRISQLSAKAFSEPKSAIDQLIQLIEMTGHRRDSGAHVWAMPLRGHAHEWADSSN
jgi:hypothetical protein